MDFKLILSKRAQNEIENAIEFYSKDSSFVPAYFIENLEIAYDDILKDPFVQRLRYNNVRSNKIKKFPYDLYFVINEQKQNIRILSCFHQKRNPKNRPRKPLQIT